VNALEALESRGFKHSPRLPDCLRLDVISLFLIIEWCYHCPVDVSLTLRVLPCKLLYPMWLNMCMFSLVFCCEINLRGFKNPNNWESLSYEAECEEKCYFLSNKLYLQSSTKNIISISLNMELNISPLLKPRHFPKMIQCFGLYT